MGSQGMESSVIRSSLDCVATRPDTHVHNGGDRQPWQANWLVGRMGANVSDGQDHLAPGSSGSVAALMACYQDALEGLATRGMDHELK